MKIKKLCKQIPDKQTVLVVEGIDEEEGRIDIFEGCPNCAAEVFGEDKIAHVCAIDNYILIIPDYVDADIEAFYDINFYEDDE